MSENESSTPPASDAPEDRVNHAAPLTPTRIMRSLLVVIIGFGATKLISLGQVILITDRFGVGADYDTYAIGNNVPTYLIRIIGVGALSFAFIPVFSGLLNRDDETGAWRLASQVFNTLLIITILLSLIVAAFAVPLVETLLAPGFNPEEVEQTAEIIRILLLSVVIFSLSSLFTGILNGYNHFFLPILAPIFYDLGLLFGVIFFTETMGVYGIAWGTVLGAVLHFSIQIPGLVMFKAHWVPSLGWQDPQLRTVIRLMIPRILASLVFAINILAIGNIASRLGEGAPSAFDWGIRIMDIPEALIGTAMGLVIFPTLSALNELGKVAERRQIFSEALRFIAVATIPAAAGMLLIGKPALYVLFPEGEAAQIETADEFTVEDEPEISADDAAAEEDEDIGAELVYAVVQILAFAMIFQALHEIVTRAFYAEKDTFIPLVASVIGMIANFIMLGAGFTAYENLDNIPLAGPLGVGVTAAGYTVSFLTELVILLIILRNRWGNIDSQRIARTISRTLIAATIMSVAVFLIDYYLAQNIFTEGTRVSGLIRAGIGSMAGISVFMVAAWFINIEEIKRLPQMIREYRQANTVPAN